MSTITREFTKEQLIEEAKQAVEGCHKLLCVSPDIEAHKISLRLAEIALASLEAEPVAWTDADELRSARNGGSGYLFAIGGDANKFANPRRQLMLYAVPPAPVVPGLKELDAILNWILMLPCPTPKATQMAKRLKVVMEACRATMLQGAEPVTTAYKLRDAVETIRNSGIAIDAEKILAECDVLNNPDCWCRACRPVKLSDMRFVVCPDCGNKRCPHANDHRNACTGSNEPGQEGSAYPAAPQQEVKP